MLTGSECKGKSYKYSEDTAIGHIDPRFIYERDRECRKRWFNVNDHATVFDFGAEYGHWCLCAIAQGARMVYAVETDRDYQLMLKINIGHNTAFNERCGIIKREIKLDQFVEHLSCAPQSIQYIRLSERYTGKDTFVNFIKNASDTIKTYKPTIIACFERNGGYLPFITGMTMLGLSYTNRSFTSNGDEYCLITFT